MIENTVKNDMTHDYKNIKYILTSTMRSQLLLALYKDSKNLEDLRNELGKPSATILHGLKELENINLVKKVQKYYKLTSNGFLLSINMIKLIENWNSINKSKLFWNNHDLSDIPDELLKNIYLLKDVRYVNSTTSDLSKAFTTYTKLIKNAKNLKIILPIYSENHFKQYIKLINGDKLTKLELIVSKNLLESMKMNELLNDSILENKKVKIKCTNRNPNLFLTYSNTFMSLTLFFNDGHYDDSQILIGKQKNAIKWAKILYHHY